MWRRLRQAIQLRQVCGALFGIALGLLLDQVTARLTGGPTPYMPHLVAASAALGILNIYLWLRSPERIKLNVKPVKILRTDAEKADAARLGLIVFVSLYQPQKDSLASRLSPQERKAAAQSKDYHALDLMASNLEPIITAVCAHASRLKHCWLIATTSQDTRFPGSREYVPVLAEHLIQTCGVAPDVLHYGAEYEVCLDDDPSVFDKTLYVMRKIFARAQSLNLRPSDLLADITGATRSMILGMILSCLDADRDIEMVGTRYGPDGRPTGPLFPMVFSFAPMLQEK